MEEYLVPTQYGEDEFIEKKSRFIGRVWPVETEEEALAKIQEMKKQHYDATHNCWAYIIHGGAGIIGVGTGQIQHRPHPLHGFAGGIHPNLCALCISTHQSPRPQENAPKVTGYHAHHII